MNEIWNIKAGNVSFLVLGLSYCICKNNPGTIWKFLNKTLLSSGPAVLLVPQTTLNSNNYT